MAKLCVFCSGVLLIALLGFSVEASSLNCPQQVQQAGYQIDHCLYYLFTSSGSGSGGEYELQVMTPEKDRRLQLYMSCCLGLKTLDRECRCDAVKQVVQGLQHQMQQGHVEDFEVKVKSAKKLPRTCDLWDL